MRCGRARRGAAQGAGLPFLLPPPLSLSLFSLPRSALPDPWRFAEGARPHRHEAGQEEEAPEGAGQRCVFACVHAVDRGGAWRLSSQFPRAAVSTSPSASPSQSPTSKRERPPLSIACMRARRLCFTADAHMRVVKNVQVPGPSASCPRAPPGALAPSPGCSRARTARGFRRRGPAVRLRTVRVCRARAHAETLHSNRASSPKGAVAPFFLDDVEKDRAAALCKRGMRR
jgi:hypothetical protein